MLEAAVARLLASGASTGPRFLFQAGQFQVRQALSEQFASLAAPTQSTFGLSQAPGSADIAGGTPSPSFGFGPSGDSNGQTADAPGNSSTDSTPTGGDSGSTSGSTTEPGGSGGSGGSDGSGETGGSGETDPGGETGSDNEPPDDGSGVIGGLLNLLG